MQGSAHLSAPSGCLVASLPKCDFNITLRKYFSTSLAKSFRLGFPGLGTKLRFFCNNLYSFLWKGFLERLMT